MIVGQFSPEDRPLISLTICNTNGEEISIDGAIDTGFLGTLLLPNWVVRHLNLPECERETVILTDGSLSELPLHEATVLWDGEEREILAFAADTITLVGFELLRDSVAYIEFFAGGSVTIEPRD